MARKYTITRIINDAAKSAARQQKEKLRVVKAKQRELESAQREAIRLRAASDKEAKIQYLESRQKEVEDNNKQLLNQINDLSGILELSLKVDNKITFDSLKAKEKFREFQLPDELLTWPPPPQLETYLSTVRKPSALEKLIPGTEGRYQKALQDAKDLFLKAQKKHDLDMSEIERKVSALREKYNKEKQDFEQDTLQQNQKIDEFEKAYRENDPSAITAYCNMVLEQSDYPEDLPQEFRLAYVPESKEMVVEYELPNKNIIPNVAEYRYTKTKDSIDEKPRKPAEVKELYQDVVASICIRTIHELFEADQANSIEIVTFNGFVDSVDPSTGRDIRPCLISVRTIKDKFKELNLNRIDKRACLRNLGAQVSSRPDELLPIKPIVEFDMVDKRFVEQSDVISDLESRPNLMDLDPFEFENLVSNLFEKIGFQTKQTRSSKDGGVDAIAYDPRPILGGKVVVQAKRYKGVVDVSAVRDLYGTMINEGANKGILVATSHYGPDAYDFSKDKPIELIDGGGLLYLLDQQGIKARIVFPED